MYYLYLYLYICIYSIYGILKDGGRYITIAR